MVGSLCTSVMSVGFYPTTRRCISERTLHCHSCNLVQTKMESTWRLRYPNVLLRWKDSLVGVVKGNNCALELFRSLWKIEPPPPPKPLLGIKAWFSGTPLSLYCQYGKCYLTKQLLGAFLRT
jgi:hypothetical protein